MTDLRHPALRAVSDAVLAGARYAALGIPDGDGGFARFLVSGMSDALIARMGPLPRTHGMLGAMLETREPYRTEDIHTHPRFRGWWPSGHPDMRSFLGVPIVANDVVIGAFYLTHKLGADELDNGALGQGREQVARTQELASEALEELRVLIGELRPADLDADGLGGALRK